MEYQNVFERTEIKYVLSPKQYENALAEIRRRAQPDRYPGAAVRSLYFDTPDYTLIRRSLSSPVYKEKLRLRVYGRADENALAFAEIKKKFDCVVYKRRVALPLAEAERWLAGKTLRRDTQIEREIDYFMSFYPSLSPRALITCARDSYISPETDLRITFDREISGSVSAPDLLSEDAGIPLLAPGYVLMEAKTGGALPLWFVKMLSENRIYKTKFSKYGTAYQKLIRETTGGKKDV